MKATYVSIWDGGTEVRSTCTYNPQTKDVTDIECNEVNGISVLDSEHIELPDGTKVERDEFTIDGE